ncbi:MAG TPA: efflux RND transporter permease subunit [Thermoanaerobaculia bacterium]|jgi:cobalt-zinc-cadmium resistance protein CzcA|nr:efflux RND transporter permease subunit [Thermoanaerobaculia bacterium]
MIERILRGSSAKPALTLLLTLAAAAAGAVWLSDLKRDVFPDLATPVFSIFVQNPAMGAEELETGVAVPLEVALAGLPEVRRIRSTSQAGVAQVRVEFEPDADYYLSRQLVTERVNQAARDLPPGTGAPLVSSLTGRLNEVMELVIEAAPGTAGLMELRELADFEVRNRMLGVPGVAAVEVLGGHLRQFQVQLDPERMAALGVTLNEVLAAVRGANENAAGGFVAQGSIEWTVRAVGRAANVGDLRSTVVTVRENTPVLLGEVAEVREAPAVRRGMAHGLGSEIVSLRVTKQFGADTMTVSRGVHEAVADLAKSLPPGVRARVLYDQAELVSSALGGVGRAVLLGALLVVAVLFLLLGNLRAALLVTLTLPLSIALAGLVLKPAGIGLNTLTLGGLAIAVGLLVDAAIILTENVYHRLTTATGATGSRPRREVALAAAIEVGRPIAFATLIVIAVFTPLFAMSGIEGRMYQPLAAAVVAAMAASLALALTLVPVLAGTFLRPARPGRQEDVALIRRIKALYSPLLDFCMRHAGMVRLLTLGITLPALLLALRIGSDFMPRLDEGALLLQTLLPPEASLDEVDRRNHQVEDVLRRFPEVKEVVRRTGRAERTEDPMPHTLSDVLVILKPDRSGSLEGLEERMRERLEKVPGVAVLFTTPLGMRIDEGLGGTPADLQVRIYGPDLERLSQLAARARDLMQSTPGIADLRAETLTGLPQVRITVDREAVARVGLTPAAVIDALRVGLAGEEISQIWVGQRRFDLVVRLDDRRRSDLASLSSLLIDGRDGTRIPLGQLTRIEQSFGPAAIQREAGSRRVAVEASVAGRDLGGAAAEVRQRLTRGLDLPTGYYFDIGGRIENQARALRSLGLAIAVALLAVLVLLYLALGSFAETFVILATLPDAFVGGILALWLAGETWNVSSLVGLIGLFGIAVQNGLVLVSQTRTLLAEGRPFGEALREASIGRVRPKLMTAGTAILGLLPLLVLHLHGSEIERPLAVVMIGGLVTSTLFTLLALPTFYQWVHQWRERIQASGTSEEKPA